MKLENPPQPEQYDPAAEQPVREMAILLGGVLVLGALVANEAFALRRQSLAETLQ